MLNHKHYALPKAKKLNKNDEALLAKLEAIRSGIEDRAIVREWVEVAKECQKFYVAAVEFSEKDHVFFKSLNTKIEGYAKEAEKHTHNISELKHKRPVTVKKKILAGLLLALLASLSAGYFILSDKKGFFARLFTHETTAPVKTPPQKKSEVIEKKDEPIKQETVKKKSKKKKRAQHVSKPYQAPPQQKEERVEKVRSSTVNEALETIRD